MKELLELRVNLDYANWLFKDSEGKKLGQTIKVIELTKHDPRYQQVPIVSQKIQEKHNKAFFYGWKIKRKYSKKEFNKASLLHLKISTTFESSGEECGTLFDNSNECSICGANREQKGSLVLKKGSIPNRDIAKTIAGEVVVSEKFVTAFKKYKFKGCSFKLIKFNGEHSDYYQIFINSPQLEISSDTVVGISPYDLSESCEGEIYKCPYGHTLGLNLISEPYIFNSKSIKEYDFFITKQNIGVKRGLLRPEPLYLCIPLVREMVEKEKLRGLEFEIAHII